MADKKHLKILRSGVLKWNQWREKYEGTPDLFAANLSNAKLGGANLSAANLSAANLSGADLVRAKLVGANLSGADLRYSVLNGADLSAANLSAASLFRAILDGAILDGAILDGAILDGPNLTYAKKLTRSDSGEEEITEVDRGRDFDVTFSPELSKEQIVIALNALADYYRACGGAGLKIDFEIASVAVETPDLVLL
jgi:hypothetical protein